MQLLIYLGVIGGLFFCNPEVLAIDSLGVGFRKGVSRWNQGVSESRFVSIATDSIWTWNVRPDQNLAVGTLSRFGSVFVPGENGEVATFLTGAEVMFDESDSTAFDPDLFNERFGVDRRSPIYIDLGATFSVNRILLYPRMDTAHKTLFPRSFQLSTYSEVGSEETVMSGNILEQNFDDVFNFYNSNPNREPIIEKRFPSRFVRFVRLQIRSDQPWEIAELKVFGDGYNVPAEYVSIPLHAVKGPRPLWGRVRYDGGEITDLPVTVQTRTGTDPTPLHYFRFTGVGGDQEEVTYREYVRLDSIEKGPISQNPDWSQWETVTDGMVASSNGNPYLQFKLLINGPGVVIKRLIFEYLVPPISSGLAAEISPIVVNAGESTPFIISLQTRMRNRQSDGLTSMDEDTGFSSLRILTDARIDAVDKVFIDDREVDFTNRNDFGEAEIIRFRRSVSQDGTFIQIFLRAAIFRDATKFDVQVSDNRLVDGRFITVYQSALEQDVDPISLGGSLIVRLPQDEGLLPLFGEFKSNTRVFSPNGDGFNDVFFLDFDLFKVTSPIQVCFEIFSRDQMMLIRKQNNMMLAGSDRLMWDGFDNSNRLVPPGIYVYRVRFQTDGSNTDYYGTLGVIY